MIPAKGYAAPKANIALEPFNFERREVGPHDVQVEILFSGVCHSDIHQARDEWGGAIFPLVPGHEIVGKVTKVGDHVTKFKVGDIAGVGVFIDSCRHCEYCKEGLEQYCSDSPVFTYSSIDHNGDVTYGGYSNNIVVDEQYTLKVSEKLPLAGVAPLLCAGITTWSPIATWQMGKGHKVGVVGLGGLGHMAVKFAVSKGAEVTVLSTSPSKKADAEKLGAHHFVVTRNKDQMAAVERSLDFIINTVSAQHEYNDYLPLLRVDGTMVLVGIPPEAPSLGAVNLISKRRRIAGSMIGGIKETQEMLDYCAEHNIVSEVEVISMDYINEAFERVLKSDVRYRFVIDMATL